jgi:hypothetical protein
MVLMWRGAGAAVLLLACLTTHPALASARGLEQEARDSVMVPIGAFPGCTDKGAVITPGAAQLPHRASTRAPRDRSAIRAARQVRAGRGRVATTPSASRTNSRLSHGSAPRHAAAWRAWPWGASPAPTSSLSCHSPRDRNNDPPPTTHPSSSGLDCTITYTLEEQETRYYTFEVEPGGDAMSVSIDGTFKNGFVRM